MADSLLRQWHILRMIPRAPRGITINQIISNLRNHPLTVPDYRTIQRDLDTLSCVFPLQSEKRSKAFYWSMHTILEIPEMEPSTALAFCLAEHQLQAQMPPDALEHLEAHFNTAAELLNRHNSTYAQWREKIRVLPQTQQLIPPHIDAQVANTVYTALLENRRFEGKYLARGKEHPTHYRVNPLALIFRGTVTYLICTLDNHTDVRYLALHRFVEAKQTEQQHEIPLGFDLDAYIRDGNLDFLISDDNLELEILVDKQIAIHLSESKLAEDQQLTHLDNGQSLFKATSPDTGQLRWWLLGFAERIEILKPETLRQKFKETIDKMKARYNDPPK
ncbi:helix-turn-helix transcriptional regulator [Nitrosomonas communis]|uniref:Predicted DNA-binding transcriptional regulator YafY, contains an HTH and WYL domains n=1 Tax=Nitrosomonas communis TaxID=44574 RepID=A0A1I4TCY5_9PROT|nr:WYL domain-containing protein [Nitrosomonas communis]SFM74515.1 Predicted DNA-binding transcriptional regulator YafY, contains an HTH and WYL domains [Nitrosomonas communis]